jgi:hypothetical protein
MKTTLTGTLTDIMPESDGTTFNVSNGQVDVTVPARSARVLVKK